VCKYPVVLQAQTLGIKRAGGCVVIYDEVLAVSYCD
jgi:hypothetical protein